MTTIDPDVLAVLAGLSDEVLLLYLVERGALWCDNCDGRKCMSCVLRHLHDVCEDDCPECCLIGWTTQPTLRSALPQGWAR